MIAHLCLSTALPYSCKSAIRHWQNDTLYLRTICECILDNPGDSVLTRGLDLTASERHMGRQPMP